MQPEQRAGRGGSAVHAQQQVGQDDSEAEHSEQQESFIDHAGQPPADAGGGGERGGRHDITGRKVATRCRSVLPQWAEVGPEPHLPGRRLHPGEGAAVPRPVSRAGSPKRQRVAVGPIVWR